MDGDVFRALADPSRRLLLDRLNERNGQSLRELCAGLEMTRQAVSKHLAVLEAAGLVATTWSGREKLHHLDAAPINAIADRWISRYHRHRARALADLKTALETTMPEFVYTTYIRTTPERLWQALRDPAFTRAYWGVEFTSDWSPGAAMAWDEAGVRIAGPEQVVLACEPYRRLAYTWHTFTPEWAAAHGIGEDLLAGLNRERRSTVTFDIEPLGGTVRLTVTHGELEPDGTLAGMVSQGWPRILSSLKTLLETGATLPDGTPSGHPREETS